MNLENLCNHSDVEDIVVYIYQPCGINLVLLFQIKCNQIEDFIFQKEM